MTLGEYLSEAGRTRWEWSVNDCATFPAGWAITCGHPDPMVGWRGTYSSEDEAQAIVDEAGGLIVLWSAALSAFSIVSEPQKGDIGICAVMGEDGLTANGGIFAGERWAFLAPSGLHCAPVEPQHILKAWRL